MIEYADVYTSLLRFSSDFCERMFNQFGTPLTPINFNIVAEIGKLPAGDLFGFMDWSLEKDNDIAGFSVDLLFGFSVVEDTNLEVLEMKCINELVKQINKKGCSGYIPVYKANQDIEEVLGNLIFSKTFKVQPATSNSSRTFKMVYVTLYCSEILLE
jgi:hypothetical protein